MHHLLTAYAAVTARWAQITDENNSDRGEGPVSTAVVIAVAAAAAVVLGAIILAAVKNWGSKIPT